MTLINYIGWVITATRMSGSCAVSSRSARMLIALRPMYLTEHRASCSPSVSTITVGCTRPVGPTETSSVTALCTMSWRLKHKKTCTTIKHLLTLIYCKGMTTGAHCDAIHSEPFFQSIAPVQCLNKITNIGSILTVSIVYTYPRVRASPKVGSCLKGVVMPV